MGQPSPRKVAKNAVKIKNADGTFSTERTITVSTNSGYVNVPTVQNGKQLSDSIAINRAFKTGNHSRSYSTIKQAEMAARRRSGAIGRASK